MSVLLPVQGEVEAEDYGEPGTDFRGLATAWFAHNSKSWREQRTEVLWLLSQRRCASPSRWGLPSSAGKWNSLHSAK